MMKTSYIFIGILALLTLIGVGLDRHVNGSSDGSPPQQPQTQETETPIPKKQDGTISARIRHARDVLQPNTLFVEARAYPGNGVPNITGGYAETNVHLQIIIKGVSVPSACQSTAERNKPHDEVEIERRRWQNAIDYVWACLSQNNKLRLGDLEIRDGRVHCHVEFYLGGAWHDLATAMVNDDHARYEQEGIMWKWGSRLLDPIPIETGTQ